MAQCGLLTKNIIKMDKAKRILEEALSYKNCDGLIEENSRLEDAVLYAINKALRQPLVMGSCLVCGKEIQGAGYCSGYCSEVADRAEQQGNLP